MNSIKKIVEAKELVVAILVLVTISAGGFSSFTSYMSTASEFSIGMAVTMGGVLLYVIYKQLLLEQAQRKTESALLKMSVHQIYQQYKGQRRLSSLEKKYLYDLEQQRKSLGVNSHTHDMINELLNKNGDDNG